MNTRADIEEDLAKAEVDLAQAAANLANACASHAETDVCLPKVFSNLTKEKVDVAQANADLAKARDSCRRARIALANLNRVAGMPIDYRSEPTLLAGESVLEMADSDWLRANDDRRKVHSNLTGAQVTERMTEADRRTVGDDRRFARTGLANRNHAEMIAKSDGRIDRPIEGSAARQSSSRQNQDQRFVSHSSSQAVGSKDTGAWRSLAWQATELSSLTLAYLLYYYIDVNLQIATLPPSVGSVLVG